MPDKEFSPREAKRRRVLMTGTVFTPDGALKVRIRDVSRTGAHVATEERVRANCDAIFRKGELFVAARIVWVRGKVAGLKFYRELADDESVDLFNPVVDS